MFCVIFNKDGTPKSRQQATEVMFKTDLLRDKSVEAQEPSFQSKQQLKEPKGEEASAGIVDDSGNGRNLQFCS